MISVSSNKPPWKKCGLSMDGISVLEDPSMTGRWVEWQNGRILKGPRAVSVVYLLVKTPWFGIRTARGNSQPNQHTKILTHQIQWQVGWPWKMIWKVKTPYKVACFIWLLAKNRALTQDRFHLSSRCFLCGEQAETINHLFLHCKWADQLWSMFINQRGISWVMPQVLTDALISWNREGSITIQKERWKIVPARIWWTLWKERNQICFEDKENSLQKIKLNCLGLFHFWGKHLCPVNP